MDNVSILIPVYNSEQTIKSLCNTLIWLFSDYTGFQVVLVNDGSRDKSSYLCRELCTEHPDIFTFVELSRNFGEHNALMAGLHYVTGDFCVMMDDDFQTAPNEVMKLVGEARKGWDVVYSYYEVRKDPPLRKFGSYFHNKVAAIVMNKPEGLYLSSFKCISRFLIDEIIRYDGQNPYIDGIILRSTDRIGSVCVEHNARKAGQSGYTLRKLVGLWGSMVLNFSLIPLRCIGVLGLVLTVCSAVYGLHRRFFDAPYDPLTEQEWSMTILLLLFGLLFSAIALLAEYIGRMHLFLNKEPQYIIRQVIIPKPETKAVREAVTYETCQAARAS